MAIFIHLHVRNGMVCFAKLLILYFYKLRHGSHLCSKRLRHRLLDWCNIGAQARSCFSFLRCVGRLLQTL